MSTNAKSRETTLSKVAKSSMFAGHILLGMSAFGWMSSVAVGAPSMELKPAQVKSVYAPHGYDTNDQVEVVVHYYLPNACYKPGPVSFDIQHDASDEKGLINIDVQWVHHLKEVCNQILIEHTEVVNLGYLEAKTYEILVGDELGLSKYPLNIKEAVNSSQDDYTYLPVESIYLEGAPLGQTLVLRGIYPEQSTLCLSASSHQVYRQPDNVIVVLPIGKLEECPKGQESKAFEYRIPLLGDLEVKKETLVHVRALNGRSVNKVFDKVVVLF